MGSRYLLCLVMIAAKSQQLQTNLKIDGHSSGLHWAMLGAMRPSCCLPGWVDFSLPTHHGWCQTTVAGGQAASYHVAFGRKYDR